MEILQVQFDSHGSRYLGGGFRGGTSYFERPLWKQHMQIDLRDCVSTLVTREEVRPTLKMSVGDSQTYRQKYPLRFH